MENDLVISLAGLKHFYYGGNPRNKFCKEILPDDLKFPNELEEKKSTYSKVINGTASKDHYEKEFKVLEKKDNENDEKYTIRLGGYIEYIQKFWKKKLKERTPENISLNSFLEDDMLKTSDIIEARLSAMVNSPKETLNALVALTFLSVTRLCWEQWNDIMLDMILPEKKAPEKPEAERKFDAALELMRNEKPGIALNILLGIKDAFKNNLRREDEILYGNVLEQLSICYKQLNDNSKSEFYRKEAYKYKNENIMIEYAGKYKNINMIEDCCKICEDLIKRIPV